MYICIFIYTIRSLYYNPEDTVFFAMRNLCIAKYYSDTFSLKYIIIPGCTRNIFDFYVESIFNYD